MLCFVQMPLQCFACDEVTHEIPMHGVGKVVVQLRKVGMRQARQQEHFAIERVGSFNHFLGCEKAQIDLFNGNETITTLCILCLVDNPEAPLSYLTKKTVTLLEQGFFHRSMHRFSPGKTLRCLLLVGCTTAITVEEGGRNIHHPLPLQVSMSCSRLSPVIDDRER